MHQIQFWLGLCPRPPGGAYSAPQTPGFEGPTSKGREGKGGDEGKEGVEGRKGKGGETPLKSEGKG